MMKYLSRIFKILYLTTLSFIVVSCNSHYKSVNVESIGQVYGFEKVLFKGGDFWITTYQKIQDKNKPYVFYIEGDGAAFDGKYKISANPTPRRQVLIKLASMDTRPNVIYIARPCQYTPMDLNPKCSKSYWTDKRLSDDSVAAMNEVINKTNNGQKFSLVGYSGGGGVAILIAARNPMVKDIITVAGNLDHRSFTSYHNVTPMLGSLNPIDYAKKISSIPQWHLSGGKDKIVPPFIADRYVQESKSNCVKQKIFPDLDHKNGWDKAWEYIYTTPIRCYN